MSTSAQMLFNRFSWHFLVMVSLCSGLAKVTHQKSVTYQKTPNTDFIAEGDSVVDQERSLSSPGFFACLFPNVLLMQQDPSRCWQYTICLAAESINTISSKALTDFTTA